MSNSNVNINFNKVSQSLSSSSPTNDDDNDEIDNRQSSENQQQKNQCEESQNDHDVISNEEKNNDDEDEDDNSTNIHSSNSTYSSSSDNRWSISVRINSAIDLPSSIIPTVPLCPLLKFGLITVTDKDEVEDLEKSSAQFRRQEYENSERVIYNDKSSLDSSGFGGSLSNDDQEKDNEGHKKQESLRIYNFSGANNNKGILAKFQNKLPLEECLATTISGDDDSGNNDDENNTTTRCKILHSSSKIMSKKDNGMMEWHEEIRWDDVEMPLQTVLCVELSAKAVYPPSVMKTMNGLNSNSNRSMKSANSVGSNGSLSNYNNNKKNNAGHGSNSAPPSGNGGLLGFWRKGRNRRGIATLPPSGPGSSASSHHESDDIGMENDDEMEKATAAAAVARYLMSHQNQHESKKEENNNEGVNNNGNIPEIKQGETKKNHHDEDIRLGTLLIPISNLPLEEEIPTVEKWFQFDSVAQGSKKRDNEMTPSKVPSLRSPSILLQISLSNPSMLDQLEEDRYVPLLDDKDATKGNILAQEMMPSLNSIDQQTSSAINDLKYLTLEKQKNLNEGANIEKNGPYLEPGIVDHICVVGPDSSTHPGEIKGDKGWVGSNVECSILEQFPPEGYHMTHGRQASLPEKVEWWCFPEGCRLWQGNEPPTHMDMNSKRYSASSPPTLASSIASFDEYLDCTSSFMWWVMSSNSDVYGSAAKKIYGAVIRFYVPIPTVQPDYSKAESDEVGADNGIRLWSPMGICVTSHFPIIGILQALLLRICQKLSANVPSTTIHEEIVHKDLLNLILNYQAPIPGIINCSIPFLSEDGDRLLISLPPSSALPPLPHGASVTSVCRLLGAEGLTTLLASVLTECKILIHSADVCNLAMVAEVITSLIYPFKYQLPYIPVIPSSLMEMLEAPVSYLIGVPTCNMKWVDKAILTDVVVIDLDNGLSTPDYFDGRQGVPISSRANPLPASVTSNITKAVFRLLTQEERIQNDFGSSTFSGTDNLPRLDSESPAERNFRIVIAQQICSLMRGYQECLFFVSANQPVFNRDRFLRQAPSLFEEKSHIGQSNNDAQRSQRILSPRSKRFLSNLVNTQHFHDLLERLDNEELTFFHQVMNMFQSENTLNSSSVTNQVHIFDSEQQIDAALKLSETLKETENKIPTYHVYRDGIRQGLKSLAYEDDGDINDGTHDNYMASFTSMLFKVAKTCKDNEDQEESLARKQLLQELTKQSKTSLQYSKLFDIKMAPSIDNDSDGPVWSKIQLKEAIGERKFREWKIDQERKDFNKVNVGKSNRYSFDSSQKNALDLMKLIPAVYEDEKMSTNFISGGTKPDTGERDVVRRYIEKACELSQTEHNNGDYGSIASNIIDNIDIALRTPSAQRFLVSLLSQRARLQNSENRQIDRSDDDSVSRLHPIVFETLVRLCNAMLDSCMREFDFESAYHLLTHTTGFCSSRINGTNDDNTEVLFMTKSVGNHVIYSDLRLWEKVVSLHKRNGQREKNASNEAFNDQETNQRDEFDATVSTLYEMLGYGIPANDLAKFASRIATIKLFSSDRAEKIMMLARRLALKRDVIDNERDLMLGQITSIDTVKSSSLIAPYENLTDLQWEEVSWSHSTSHNESKDEQIGQSPITALTSFGSSLVVSGALDGSVYLAHTFNLGKKLSSNHEGKDLCGIRLECSKQFSSTLHPFPVEDNIAAISCLAASKGATHTTRTDAFVSNEDIDEDAIIEAVSGCRIIGGMTDGDIRVWSVQDILTHEFAKDSEDTISMTSDILATPQSSLIRSRANASIRALEASKQGRFLGNHRGGCQCLSIPDQIYRPDSLISGGNDGLIKQWSLDPKSSSRRKSLGGKTSRILFSGRKNSDKSTGQEEVNVLAGHGGKVLCLETAWYCDKLLSGSADQTMKLWDLASNTNQCIQTMTGHSGWVTNVRFWGRHTLISSSTDRSIALWDIRSGSSPIAALRLHQSPVSDLYIESRKSYWMTSAGADGVIATWDFRKLGNLIRMEKNQHMECTKMIRQPVAKMSHCQSLQNIASYSSPVFLSRGIDSKYGQSDRTFMSVGSDGNIKEWDAMSGMLLSSHTTQHSNQISCFRTFTDTNNLMKCYKSRKGIVSGTITAGWDGNIKLRRMVLKRSHD